MEIEIVRFIGKFIVTLIWAFAIVTAAQRLSETKDLVTIENVDYKLAGTYDVNLEGKDATSGMVGLSIGACRDPLKIDAADAKVNLEGRHEIEEIPQ